MTRSRAVGTLMLCFGIGYMGIMALRFWAISSGDYVGKMIFFDWPLHVAKYFNLM